MALALNSLAFRNTMVGAVLQNTPLSAGALVQQINTIATTFPLSVVATGSSATAGQISLAWTYYNTSTGNIRNVVNGTPWVIDVTSLTQADGSTITFGHVNYFGVFNLSTTATDNLVVGTSGSNPLFGSDQITANANAANTSLLNSGAAQWQDLGVGFPVSGSAKLVQIAAAAGTVPTIVFIFGRDT
jgi:hypothetical protein